MSSADAEVEADVEETEAAPAAPKASLVVLSEVPVGASFRLPSSSKSGKVVNKGKNNSYVEVLYTGSVWPLSIAPGMLVEVLPEVQVAPESRLVPAAEAEAAEVKAAEAAQAQAEAEAKAKAAQQAQAEAEAKAKAAQQAQAEAEAKAKAIEAAQAFAQAAAQAAQTYTQAQAAQQAAKTQAESSEKSVSLSDAFTSLLLAGSTNVAEFFKLARQVAPESACAKSLTSCQNQVQVLRSKLKKAGLLPK